MRCWEISSTNACKWARTKVSVSAARIETSVRISVEDDGPGLSGLEAVDMLRPGKRIDESMPGYGFGLPITRELAELHGGSLGLDTSPLGGLLVSLTLPGD